MTAIYITEKTAREVVVPAKFKSIRVPDMELPGFAIQKTQTGNTTYIVRYRNAEGKERQEKIGKVGQIPTAH